jgi:hypothetical protein
MSTVKITADDLKVKNGYQRVVKRNRKHASLAEIGREWRARAEKGGRKITHRTKVSKASRGPTSATYPAFAKRYAREYRAVYGSGPAPSLIGSAWTAYVRGFAERNVNGITWREFTAQYPRKSVKALRALWVAGTARPVPAKVVAKMRAKAPKGIKAKGPKAPAKKTLKFKTMTARALASAK